jgi:PEGA domain
MRRPACVLLALLLAGSAGCVTRRFVITSDPPGAMVYREGQPIGPTPVEQPFVYYGKYRFRLVADGHEPLDVTPELVAPWYQFPGVDFVTENLVPFTFRDVQVLKFTLAPLQPVRPDDVQRRAEQLQERGRSIVVPPGEQPAPPPRTAPISAPPSPGAPIPPTP